ncbi:hypothetical protein N473_02955 [Pseudoalteromonas luteoviolacea CPMOR-1]|uniref:Uncharacterized protein n=1 Tax=Pseudoalteromonas luteoviolacea CPMOR-1 TaxID=1365248 RepID=A0A167ITA9_9GAMM|nr:hypothetical protein [Pseudoalteromonas luteoviolacea]KZN59893.1 hypothetical protein N473_02955 [Pseudoalteromonas luteoviolacea CPMOR-1]
MKILNALLLGLIFSIAQAQEHLVPEPSIYSNTQISRDYHLYVARAFKKSFSSDVILKVVSIHSFHPESVLFLKSVDKRYSLVFLKAESHYWQTYRNNVPVHPIEKCSISISKQLALQLEKVWSTELLNARYPSDMRQGMDGTTYYFSTPNMAGKTWSPDKNTPMGKLVNLVYELQKMCLSNSDTSKVNNALEMLAVK